MFVAGEEFGELAGHLFQIVKALCGLKSSGKRWHGRLHDVLRDLGFKPSLADDAIWMKDKGDHYEYIVVHVDDLLIASRNTETIVESLESNPVNFKLKGTGLLEFHLGCDYFRDEDGTLCYGPKKYIGRMVDAHTRMFGSRPSTKHLSPLAKNDHPEIDTIDLLDKDGSAQYQSLIGILQWTITLGRFDVGTVVMTMSGFRIAPRVGHLACLRRICGYLVRYSKGCTRVRMEKLDCSGLPDYDQDWLQSVYGDIRESKPENSPTPRGKSICTTMYKDTNLCDDLVTGRAVTGIFHFINKTPINWFSKKQSTMETATYGSEFSSVKTAIEQIQGLRTMLRYLGVPVDNTSYCWSSRSMIRD